jgi:hypothetical protein
VRDVGKMRFCSVAAWGRLELLLQEAVEKDARLIHLDAKCVLHSAALLDYGFSN